MQKFRFRKKVRVFMTVSVEGHEELILATIIITCPKHGPLCCSSFSETKQEHA